MIPSFFPQSFKLVYELLKGSGPKSAILSIWGFFLCGKRKGRKSAISAIFS